MTIKKTLAALLALNIVFCASTAISSSGSVLTVKASETAENTDPYTQSDASFSYRIFSDNAVITKYAGTDTEVDIPSEIDAVPVTEIGDSAFAANSIIQSVAMTDNIKKINDNAFDKCTSLSNIILSDDLVLIGDNAFAYTSITDITLPDTLKILGSYAFCSSRINHINIPPLLENIKNYTFADSAITDIVIPQNITAIGYGCFAKCSNLESITFMNPDCKMDLYYSFNSNYTISNTYTYTPDTPNLCVDYNPYYNGIKDIDYHYTGKIYGYKDSAAQKYAEDCDYNFIELTEDTDNVQSSHEIKYGDVDLNGEIDMSDLTQLSLLCLGDIKVDEAVQKNADVNGNGKIDLSDLATLKQYIMLDPVRLGPAQ